ncbi:MAG TPA: alpha/beta hydrolase, partial [Baekduia sp.]|nr:alpha/beta hydrolase [Baekduia sp.]
MPEVREREEVLDGQPVRWFEADGEPGRAPVLYLHGVPMSGREWRAFLEVTGGLAPDLPGFGRSGKRADLPYDLPFYAGWIQRFLEQRGVQRVRLVAHDWGVGLGLAWAQERPDAVERLVLADGAPLLPGYRWHRLARLWRTPLVGELVMGASTPWTLRQLSRHANRRRGPMPPEWQEIVQEGWDLGTERAILRLYRSSPPEALERAGARLGELRCP